MLAPQHTCYHIAIGMCYVNMSQRKSSRSQKHLRKNIHFDELLRLYMFVLSQSERKFPYLNIGRRMEMFSVKLHDGSWHRCGFGYIRACVVLTPIHDSHVHWNVSWQKNEEIFEIQCAYAQSQLDELTFWKMITMNSKCVMVKLDIQNWTDWQSTWTIVFSQLSEWQAARAKGNQECCCCV